MRCYVTLTETLTQPGPLLGCELLGSDRSNGGKCNPPSEAAEREVPGNAGQLIGRGHVHVSQRGGGGQLPQTHEG